MNAECEMELQDIWANAHETCDSISLISCTGCLGLSPVITTNIHSSSVCRRLNSRKMY